MVTIKCKICGKEVFTIPSKAKTKVACSISCRRIWHKQIIGPISSMMNRRSYTKKDLCERFWEKVNKGKDCWDWEAHCNKGGYGLFAMAEPYSRPILAHRMSWIIHFGDIPAGMLILHHCDNRRCVNPSHLFLGTHKDNMQDASRKNRIAFGERSGHAKLSNKEVTIIRSSILCNKKLAELFNVSFGHICDIKTMKRRSKECQTVMK